MSQPITVEHLRSEYRKVQTRLHKLIRTVLILAGLILVFVIATVVSLFTGTYWWVPFLVAALGLLAALVPVARRAARVGHALTTLEKHLRWRQSW